MSPVARSSSTAGPTDPTRAGDPARRWSPAALPGQATGDVQEATTPKSRTANSPRPPASPRPLPSSTSSAHRPPASTDTSSGSNSPDDPPSAAEVRPDQASLRPSLKAQARNSFNAALRSAKAKSGRSSSSKMAVEPEGAVDVLQGRQEGREGPPPTAPSVNVPLQTSPRASTTTARQYHRPPTASSSRSVAPPSTTASHFAPKHRKAPSGSKGKSFFLKTGETEVPIPHRLANSLVLKSPESPFFARTFGTVNDPRQRFRRMATHPPAARVSPPGRASPKRTNSDQNPRPSTSAGSPLSETSASLQAASSSSSLTESVEPLSSATSSAESLSTPPPSLAHIANRAKDDRAASTTEGEPGTNAERRGSDQSADSNSSGHSSSSSRKSPSGDDEERARRSSSDVGSSGEDRTNKRRMQWADLMLGFRGVRLGDAGGERRRTSTAGSGRTVGDGLEDRSDRATWGGLEDE